MRRLVKLDSKQVQIGCLDDTSLLNSMNLCLAQTKFSSKNLSKLISTESAYFEVEKEFFHVIWVVENYFLYFICKFVLHHVLHWKGAHCAEVVNRVKTVNHSNVSLF